MTDVFWLERTEADVPGDTDWLSASEAARANGMRFAKRRADWLLGRWTAKCAVAAYWKTPATDRMLASIEIRPAVSGAPEVFVAGEAAAVAISLSHRAGRAICAVASPGTALGCDLESVEPRSEAFVSDYFTAEEQTLVARAAPADRPRLATLLWSAKESALKALGVGLRLDTRSLWASPAEGQDPDTWRPLLVRRLAAGASGVSNGPICNCDAGIYRAATVKECRIALLATDEDENPSGVRPSGLPPGFCPARRAEARRQPRRAAPLGLSTERWRESQSSNARSIEGEVFRGWWQYTGSFLRTVVATPPPWMPLALAERYHEKTHHEELDQHRGVGGFSRGHSGVAPGAVAAVPNRWSSPNARRATESQRAGAEDPRR